MKHNRMIQTTMRHAFYGSISPGVLHASLRFTPCTCVAAESKDASAALL